MSTWCSACDHVHPDTRKESPWRWRCMRAPVQSRGFGFVSPDYAPEPPYEKCDRVNQIGECEMFAPRREAPKKEAA